MSAYQPTRFHASSASCWYHRCLAGSPSRAASLKAAAAVRLSPLYNRACPSPHHAYASLESALTRAALTVSSLLRLPARPQSAPSTRSRSFDCFGRYAIRYSPLYGCDNCAKSRSEWRVRGPNIESPDSTVAPSNACATRKCPMSSPGFCVWCRITGKPAAIRRRVRDGVINQRRTVSSPKRSRYTASSGVVTLRSARVRFSADATSAWARSKPYSDSVIFALTGPQLFRR